MQCKLCHEHEFCCSDECGEIIRKDNAEVLLPIIAKIKMSRRGKRERERERERVLVGSGKG